MIRSQMGRRSLTIFSGAMGATAIFLWCAGPTIAVCGAPGPNVSKKVVSEAPVVFVGTVASVDATRNVATIDVQEIWRGPNLADPIAVSGGQSVPGSYALQWEVGQ